MTPKEAAMLVTKKHPGFVPVGYWVRNHMIVIQTKPMKAFRGMSSPAQFAVTKTGEVYATNPVMFNLTPQDLKKL